MRLIRGSGIDGLLGIKESQWWNGIYIIRPLLIFKKEQLKKEIVNDQKLINDLKDLDNYEAFARENFFMKKKDEEIFIIEFKDSIEN